MKLYVSVTFKKCKNVGFRPVKCIASARQKRVKETKHRNILFSLNKFIVVGLERTGNWPLLNQSCYAPSLLVQPFPSQPQSTPNPTRAMIPSLIAWPHRLEGEYSASYARNGCTWAARDLRLPRRVSGRRPRYFWGVILDLSTVDNR